MKSQFCILLMLGWAWSANAEWPVISFPNGSEMESAGEQVRLNGMPVRIYRGLVKQPLNEVKQFFRRSLGSSHAETRLPKGVLMTQMRGDYVLTVKVSPVNANVSEILISMGDMRAAQAAAGRPLGMVLPDGSRLLSDMESVDSGRIARQLVFSNAHSISANENALIRMMEAKGYKYVNTQKEDGEIHASSVVYFEGLKREAYAVVMREGEGSSIVLTTLQAP